MHLFLACKRTGWIFPCQCESYVIEKAMVPNGVTQVDAFLGSVAKSAVFRAKLGYFYTVAAGVFLGRGLKCIYPGMGF